MKKIILITLLFILICLPAQAKLTYLNDFRDGSITADYSLGSNAGTFTRDNKACTYIDKYGTMQVVTTANIPRYTYSSYNETGLVSTLGVYVEPSATNLWLYSMDMTNAITSDSNISITDNNTISPDGTNNADKITCTGAGGYGRQTITVVPETDYIFSFFVKNISQSTPAYRIYDITNGDWVIESTTYTAYTEKWIRVNLPFTTPTDCVSIYCFNATAMNLNEEIYIWGCQLEAGSHATSFIPTVAAAITRGAEVLKAPTLGNRSAGEESCIVKCYPNYAEDTDGDKYLTDTDTKIRLFQIRSGRDDAIVYANLSDSFASSASDIINTSWTAFQPITLGYNIQHSSPYVAGFYQGLADGTNDTTDDFTNNNYGTYFYVGSRSAGDKQFSGIIQSIAFFDEVLTDAEHLFYYNNDVSVLKIQGVELQGLAAW